MVLKKRVFLFCVLCLFLHNVKGQNVKRTYDEFTGETQITANISGPLDFAKTISESGETFVLLKWNSSSGERPTNDNLRLIILFDDKSRLSVNLPIVCKYNEFMTNIYLKAAIESETIIDPTCYSLESEVILNASQIAILKNKSIKKYRLDGYEEWVIHKNSTDSKLIFNEMLSTK